MLRVVCVVRVMCCGHCVFRSFVCYVLCALFVLCVVYVADTVV